MQIIKLPCGMTISHNDENKYNATLSPDNKEPDNTDEYKAFNSAIDALESLILAHFCAGVDVTSHGYVHGIEEAFENICNKH